MNFLKRKRNNGTEQPATSEPAKARTKTGSNNSTLKQEKFIENFIPHGNAARAARKAGYSPRSRPRQPESESQALGAASAVLI
jgi:hypothetical protein